MVPHITRCRLCSMILMLFPRLDFEHANGTIPDQDLAQQRSTRIACCKPLTRLAAGRRSKKSWLRSTPSCSKKRCSTNIRLSLPRQLNHQRVLCVLSAAG